MRLRITSSSVVQILIYHKSPECRPLFILAAVDAAKKFRQTTHLRGVENVQLLVDHAAFGTSIPVHNISSSITSSITVISL